MVLAARQGPGDGVLTRPRIEPALDVSMLLRFLAQELLRRDVHNLSAHRARCVGIAPFQRIGSLEKNPLQIIRRVTGAFRWLRYWVALAEIPTHLRRIERALNR